ncbi:hypothetical protein [Siphonobacter sp. SORGH_AS_0500]|uniref:hypothetical protein n=1 Tax=Siphonobacter sp. SORGH_AS_0500 TaxID=1864824 RepID=UPI0028631CA5|nr:hypothetical protein [Siphonobacter sp. SORGH_AS_0500]MDR6194733.1 hypothetical protein [Siphonobacter sp. SORGH_AS_0500]
MSTTIAISQVKKTISTLKMAAKNAGKLLADLSGGEYEPGEDVVSEVPLIAHQLQRYVDHDAEQQQYAGKEPHEIAAEKEQEREEAIAKMQQAAAEQLNARVQIPEPEVEPQEDTEESGEDLNEDTEKEPTDENLGQDNGDSNENPEGDQPENSDGQKQGDAETPVE